jgi:hypothetical protein
MGNLQNAPQAADLLEFVAVGGVVAALTVAAVVIATTLIYDGLIV